MQSSSASTSAGPSTIAGYTTAVAAMAGASFGPARRGGAGVGSIRVIRNSWATLSASRTDTGSAASSTSGAHRSSPAAASTSPAAASTSTVMPMRPRV